MTTLSVAIEPSPYNGQPATAYMYCCDHKLVAHLGHVLCPACNTMYTGDGLACNDAEIAKVLRCARCEARA